MLSLKRLDMSIASGEDYYDAKIGIILENISIELMTVQIYFLVLIVLVTHLIIGNTINTNRQGYFMLSKYQK